MTAGVGTTPGATARIQPYEVVQLLRGGDRVFLSIEPGSAPDKPFRLSVVATTTGLARSADYATFEQARQGLAHHEDRITSGELDAALSAPGALH